MAITLHSQPSARPTPHYAQPRRPIVLWLPLLLGLGLLLAIQKLLSLLLPDLPLTLHPLYLLLALLCSALVGLAAGIAPALRAMGQDPVVALRGE